MHISWDILYIPITNVVSCVIVWLSCLHGLVKGRCSPSPYIVKLHLSCSDPWICFHYDDVIMTMLASQITSLTVVYSIVYSDVNQRKHQSSASLAFVREIHRGPVNFPHKWPVTRKMFPFDDVIMFHVMLCCTTMAITYLDSNSDSLHHCLRERAVAQLVPASTTSQGWLAVNVLLLYTLRP